MIYWGASTLDNGLVRVSLTDMDSDAAMVGDFPPYNALDFAGGLVACSHKVRPPHGVRERLRARVLVWALRSAPCGRR